jgi:hypothetical protein
VVSALQMYRTIDDSLCPWKAQVQRMFKHSIFNRPRHSRIPSATDQAKHFSPIPNCEVRDMDEDSQRTSENTCLPNIPPGTPRLAENLTRDTTKSHDVKHALHGATNNGKQYSKPDKLLDNLTNSTAATRRFDHLVGAASGQRALPCRSVMLKIPSYHVHATIKRVGHPGRRLL